MEIEIENPNDIANKSNYSINIPVTSFGISYNTFFTQFLARNQACVLRNVSSEWNCSRLWCTNGIINLNYLCDEFGDSSVMLYNCKEKYFNSQKTEDSICRDFLHYWKAYINQNYDAEMPIFYLKDWHLKKQYPDNDFYEVPCYFASDWLNEYLTETSDDDYRFVYMGPKNSWTPFHADVFSSFSWSVNVCGKKKWLLFPPGAENKLRDSLGNLPYDLKGLEIDVPHYEIIQNSGDAVFVPSGWCHQVWNLEDTISVNHNWINGCNIEQMWMTLEKSLNDVKNEIKDCSDMENYEQHCQVMLKSYFGLDFLGYFKFLLHIAEKRINFIVNKIPVVLFEKYTLGFNHAVFDLIAIERTLLLLIRNKDLIEVTKESDVKSPKLLLANIQEILKCI